MKPISILSILTLIFTIQCSSADNKEPDKDAPDFEMRAPNIRIERFSNTKLIRAEGPVITNCGGKECSGSEVESLGMGKIKSFPKHGEWKEYLQFQDGGDLKNPKYKNVLDLMGRYENGKRVGIWKRPDPETGKTITEIPYVNGKREGIVKSFSGSTGEILSETFWKNDKQEGPFYLKSSKDGYLLEEGSYIDGKKNGEWKYYHYGKGTIKQILHYKNDLLEGEEINYFDDGKSISSQGMNREDSRVGNWKTYYKDGAVQSEGNYAPRKDGVGDSKYERVGIWKEYYPNGKLFGEGMRKHVRKGNWSFYFNDGQLRYRGVMANEVMLQSAEIFERSGKKIGEGKFFFSLVMINDETGDIKDSYKPDIPFTYFHDNGKKRLDIISSENAVEYDASGKEIGRGGSDAQGRKSGCWKESGSVMFYMLGKARPTMTANACK
jgi:antitoxin component YwqK of YwqJK toxin-antitoxin module